MDKFDGIRPYNDREVAEAMKRLGNDPIMQKVYQFLYKDANFERFRELLLSINSADEFQVKVISNILNIILKTTTDNLSISGISNIDPRKKYLFISNHRDIILDSAILQLILHNNNIPTTIIAGGDNLINTSFAEDIMRCNKMLIVSRGGTSRDIYKASMLLSEYIRETVSNQAMSFWIAQNSGRSKDGNDVTGQGILKMFDMSGSKDFEKDFNELNILPFAVSYQFESCDFLKTKELYYKSKTDNYIKEENEDVISMVTGLTQFKGGVDFSFAKPLTSDEISKIAKLDKNDKFLALAELIDNRIQSAYKLWNNNYIAHDILSNSEANKNKYTPEEKDVFIAYMEKGIKEISPSFSDKERDTLRNIFLSIYANPVKN